MALVAPPANEIRGFVAGSKIPTAPVTSLSAPTVTLTQEVGRSLLAAIGGLDPLADGVELYLDGAPTPVTLVATSPWFSVDPYSTGDLGDGVTRYARALAFVDMPDGRVYSAYSSIVSATTQAAVPAPGAAFGFTLTNNGDGTGDLSFSVPDDFATEQQAQIWNGSSWAVLATLGAEATGASDVPIPGSSGATPNASNEYGLRIRRANGAGASFSNEQWVPITDQSGAPDPMTAGTLGSVVPVSSSSLRIPLAVAPTGYTSMQLQRSLTGGASGGSWSDISGADAESDFAGGGYLDTGRSASTAYYYRLAISDGTTTIYSNVASGITQSASGGSVFFSDSLASGFDSRWNRGNGSKWSAQSGFARCSYTGAGTTGTQLLLPFGQNVRELWIAFDCRYGGSSAGNCKTLKLFDPNNGKSGQFWSNTTYHGNYTSRSWYGFAFGQNRNGTNDTQAAARFNGSHTQTVPFTTVTARGSHMPGSTSFQRHKVYVRQSSGNGSADGIFKSIVDGVTQLHCTGVLNRHDAAPGFNMLGFGDYTPADVSFQFEIRNVVVSFGSVEPS